MGLGTTTSQKLHIANGAIKVETNVGSNSVDISQGSVVTNEGAGGTSRYVTSIGGTWTWGLGKTNTASSNFQIINYPRSNYDLTILNTNGNVGIGNTGPSNKLSVTGNADFSGNVGIGTTTPAHKLEVAGNMRLAGTLYDKNNFGGNMGQLLCSMESGVYWYSAPFLWTDATTYLYPNNHNYFQIYDDEVQPQYGTGFQVYTFTTIIHHHPMYPVYTDI